MCRPISHFTASSFHRTYTVSLLLWNIRKRTVNLRQQHALSSAELLLDIIVISKQWHSTAGYQCHQRDHRLHLI